MSGPVLGNEGLSRGVRFEDVLKLPLILTCMLSCLKEGMEGRRDYWIAFKGLFQLYDLTKCLFFFPLRACHHFFPPFSCFGIRLQQSGK